MKLPQKPKAVAQTPLALLWKTSLLLGLALINFSGSSFAQGNSPVPKYISQADWARLRNAPRQRKIVRTAYEVRRDDVLSIVEGDIAFGVELTVNGSLFVDDSFVGGSGHLRVQKGGRLILSKGTLVGIKTTIERGGILIIADPQTTPLPVEPPKSYRYGDVDCYGEIAGAGKIESDVFLKAGGSIALDASETLLKWVSSPSASLITITGSLNSSSGSVSEKIQVTGTNTSTHGQLAVYGTVAINGATLSVTTTAYTSGGVTYYPTAGAVFDMIKATSVTGTGFIPKPVNDTKNGSYTHGIATCSPYQCYNLTRN